MKDIFETIEQHGRNHPQTPAIMFADDLIVWGELLPRINAVCLGLAHKGMRAGRGVAVLLQNTKQLPLIFLGIIRGRSIIVPLDPGMGEANLSKILALSKPELLVFDTVFQKLADKLQQNFCFRKIIPINSQNSSTNTEWQQLENTDAKGANFPETKFEAVVYHHYQLSSYNKLSLAYGSIRNLILNAHSACRLLKFTAADRHLCLLPTNFRIFEQVLRPLFSGSSLILNPATNISKIIKIINNHSISVLLAPAYYWRLLCDFASATDQKLQSLRVLESCGHTSQWVERRVRKVLKKELVITTPLGASLGAVLGPKREDSFSSGKRNQPCPGLLLKISNKQDKPVSQEEVGELRLKGNLLVRNLQTVNEEKHTVFASNNWWHTGIYARYSLANDIELLGEQDEVISKRGETIFLREIKLCLERNKDVLEAAVVSLQLKDKKIQTFAIVRLANKEQVSVDALSRYLRHRLRPRQMPEHILLLQHLPRLPEGSIDRQRLQEQLWYASMAKKTKWNKKQSEDGTIFPSEPANLLDNSMPT